MSTWAFDNDDVTYLKLPSGKVFRVFDISVGDGNDYKVIEASDWADLCFDILINPGRTSKGLEETFNFFIALSDKSSIKSYVGKLPDSDSVRFSAKDYAVASRVLGYRRNWLGRVLNRSGRTLKALQGIGFSAKTEKLAAQSKQGNWVNSNTISSNDLDRTMDIWKSQGSSLNQNQTNC